MRWLAALSCLLLACGPTEEMRAWAERRATLERRQAELMALEHDDAEAARRRAAWKELQGSLDVAAFVREHEVDAKVFGEPGKVRVALSGTSEHCRDELTKLQAVRWLLSRWRLRLEGERCEWEGTSDAVLPELERALVLPPARFTPPERSLCSRGREAEQARVRDLEVDVARREGRLGVLASLGHLARAGALVTQLQGVSAPCDLPILERELAQDHRGALLEISEQRLVHPLEPRGDPRLRALVEVSSFGLEWRCAPVEPQ